MNILLYKAGIKSFELIAKAISPFNSKAAKWTAGRKNLLYHIKYKMQGNKDPVAWFHCASLGEFEQARPVLEKFKEIYFRYKIVVTFFSPSGYEIRKNYEKADYVFYLPADSRENAQKFLDAVNPKIALFAKYDLWYFYLDELQSRKVPTLLFSSIFRNDQLFFKSYGSFYRSFLKRFERIFVQNENSYYLLKSIGIKNVEIAGDTRFDRVKAICQEPRSIEIAEKFKAGKKVFIIGSSWPQDMKLLVPFINAAPAELKFIIAPHEIHKEEITKMQEQITKRTILFSEAAHASPEQADVLIIDNIGMLSSLYQYAEFAYIGGAFGKGLHNILEAATFGMPIFFGPNHKKFNEAVELVSKGGAFSINTLEELTGIFLPLYNSEEKMTTCAGICRAYVENNTGATDKIIRHCRQIV